MRGSKASIPMSSDTDNKETTANAVSRSSSHGEDRALLLPMARPFMLVFQGQTMLQVLISKITTGQMMNNNLLLFYE
jgi:hypothetical protein